MPKLDKLVPLKLAFDSNTHIAILELLLIEENSYYIHLCQHPNIKVTIAIYQSNKLNCSKVYVTSGKVIIYKNMLKSEIPI